jgi:prepilin-type N-terminal cleavage/methylation domain-containing protein
MKDRRENKTSAGFSIVELLIAMTIILVVLGLASTLFSKSLNTRRRESSQTDALTAAQATLNVISCEHFKFRLRIGQ